MKWKIPLYKIFTDQEDIKLILNVIKRGMTWTLGPEIEEFETLLAKYIGCNYSVAFNSGTSAGHAALIALGIKPNDEILVPSFSFISTANWPLMVNALPKFVDIENETYGLDPQLIGPAISKKTKAVIPVHYAGLPCKIENISEITKRKRILLIEDSAESLGAEINKKKVGTYGDVSIFSFASNKVLSTGDGGAITTNNKKIYEKLKLIRSHGRQMNENYFSSITKPDYLELGYNWRMSSITAALAISQLKKIEKLITMRRRNASYLSSKLSKFKQIKLHTEPTGYRHVYQLYSIRLPNSNIRNKLKLFLTKKGIMSKTFFEPIHLTHFYKKLGFGATRNLNLTVAISNQILSLPMYPGLQKSELDYIYDSINEFMEKF